MNAKLSWSVPESEKNKMIKAQNQKPKVSEPLKEYLSPWFRYPDVCWGSFGSSRRDFLALQCCALIRVEALARISLLSLLLGEKKKDNILCIYMYITVVCVCVWVSGKSVKSQGKLRLVNSFYVPKPLRLNRPHPLTAKTPDGPSVCLYFFFLQSGF